ncbi:MAG: hypothetical protein QOE11_1354 [Solirubrobacteraceae bacterium]|jgi:hypothetical protein|nr:hypothetical protein [Solirubrobacteraceae bacterium]
MPRLRPQQTFLSGLGVAGAVLAAVVVTFTLASGIVAYSLTSDDPLTPSSGALVLTSSGSGELARSPLVLRSVARPATRTRTSSSSAAQVAGGARGALSGSVSGQVSSGGGGGGQGDGDTQGVSSQPARPPAGGDQRKPVGSALGQTTPAVGTPTGTLARRLSAVTGDLRTRATPLVQDTGDLLRNVVGGSTGAVSRLLGRGTP